MIVRRGQQSSTRNSRCPRPPNTTCIPVADECAFLISMVKSVRTVIVQKYSATVPLEFEAKADAKFIVCLTPMGIIARMYYVVFKEVYPEGDPCNWTPQQLANVNAIRAAVKLPPIG